MASEKVKLYLGGLYYFRGAALRDQGDGIEHWAKPPGYFRLLGEATNVHTASKLFILAPDEPNYDVRMLAVTTRYLIDNFDPPAEAAPTALPTAQAVGAPPPEKKALAPLKSIEHPIDPELIALIGNCS